MDWKLTETIGQMQRVYDEFERAIKGHKENHPAAGVLERDLPMFGRYFAGFSTCLEVLDNNLIGNKPESFKIVRTALGKVHGKKPLLYHLRDIGRDYNVREEGVEELLRYVPEVISFAEDTLERNLSSKSDVTSKVSSTSPSDSYAQNKENVPTLVLKMESASQETGTDYRVVPEEKPDYPDTFKNLIESVGSLFETVGKTKQQTYLRTAVEQAVRDLFNYSMSPDGTTSLIPLPDELISTQSGVSIIFEVQSSVENLDQIPYEKIRDYAHSLRNFVDQEKTEWDRQIQTVNNSRRNRERNPS